MISKNEIFVSICVTETDGIPVTCCIGRSGLNSFNVEGVYCWLQIVVSLGVRALLWQ